MDIVSPTIDLTYAPQTEKTVKNELHLPENCKRDGDYVKCRFKVEQDS